MPFEVAATLRQRFDVFLAEILFRDAALHLQCLDRRNEDNSVRRQARLAALDVEEFFRTEVSAETRLRDHVIRHFEGRTRLP